MKLYGKSAQLHFFFDRTNKSQSFRFDVEMSEPVNDGVLLAALKKTLELFRTAACRPIITPDGKRVAMEKNPAEPVIYHSDEPAALGTDETNGYLFRVISKGSGISLSVFHAMCDAGGAHLFLAHLLWFYLTGLGHDVDPEGLLLKPEDLSEHDVTAELEDKLEEFGVSGGFINPEAPTPDKVFHDPREEELYDTDVFSATRYAMPFAQVKQLTRALGTTPMLLFYVLCAQAMRETSEVGDKVVHCCFAADLRSRLNSRSITEFGSMSNLYYTEADGKLSLEEQLGKAKADFDKAMAGILSESKDMLDTYDQAVPYFNFALRDQWQPQLGKRAKATSSSMFLTNMGAFRFPKGMMPFMKSVHLIGAPAKFDPTIGLYTFGDTLYLSYFHNSTDDAHVDRLAEKLRALGVDCRREQKQTMKGDYLGHMQPFDQTESVRYLLGNKKLILFPKGDLDTAASAEQIALADELLRTDKVSVLEMDLTKVTSISPDGFRMLMHFAGGGYPALRVINAPQGVYENLAAAGLTTVIKVRKKPREIAVDAGSRLAGGTTAEVFRLDGERIVKVYHPENDPEWIEAQRNNAQTFFLLGIPSAAVYDTVSVGGRAGVIYEYLDAASLGEAISKEPERLEEYAEKLAALLKKIHAAQPDRSRLVDTLSFLSGHFNLAAINRYTAMDYEGLAKSINEGNTLVHGDFHPMNVLVKNGELILIDTGDAYYRYGFLDVLTLYVFLIIRTDTEEKSQKLTGMTRENAHRLWDAFVRYYLAPQSDGEKDAINDLLHRMAMGRLAMAQAVAPGDETVKAAVISKILAAPGMDADVLKKDIDAFEEKYEARNK